MARLSCAGACSNDIVHRDGADQRDRVVALALSGADLGRLQRRDADLVRVDVLHGHGHLHQFRVRMDAAEIRQPLDWRDSAREPQPLYTGDLHAIDAGYRSHQVVYRRIRLRAADYRDRVCSVFLEQKEGTAGAGNRGEAATCDSRGEMTHASKLKG